MNKDVNGNRKLLRKEGSNVKGMKVFIDQRGHRGKTQRKRKKSHFVSFAGIWNK